MQTFGFILMVLFMTSVSLWAQGGPDSPDCTTCIHLTDATCTVSANCDDGADCQTTTFVAPCDDWYTLNAEIHCSDGHACYYCVSCVHIKRAGVVISTAHTGCAEDGCTGTAQVQLEALKTYTLVVCKRSCNSESCDYCTECTARGELKYPVSTCPSW